MNYLEIVNKINGELPDMFQSYDGYLTLCYSTDSHAEVVELQVNECNIIVFSSLHDTCESEQELKYLIKKNVSEFVDVLNDFKSWIHEN